MYGIAKKRWWYNMFIYCYKTVINFAAVRLQKV